MRVARGLLFLADVDLAAELGPIAYCTDASLRGYSVLTSEIDGGELRPLVAYRERMRFSRKEKFVEREHDGFVGALAGPVTEKDFWDGVLPRPAGARRAASWTRGPASRASCARRAPACSRTACA